MKIGIKDRARDLVCQALVKGLLIKPEACACGEPRVEAHHTDYTKPLEVTWLCSACHKLAHAEIYIPTHCPQGHEYKEDNLRVVTLKDGYTRRRCRTCDKSHCRKWWNKNRAKMAH